MRKIHISSCNLRQFWKFRGFFLNKKIAFALHTHVVKFDICQFWHTTALFKPLESTAISAKIRDTTAKFVSDEPKEAKITRSPC